MRRVKRRDTKPELLLRNVLWHRGLRYRLHAKNLPGTPDVVFPGIRLAVFVHGCFWHRHPGCVRASTPRSNVEFWTTKFDANVARDARNVEELTKLGWHTFVVWECEAYDAQALERVADAIERLVRPVP